MKDKKELLIYIFIMLILINYYLVNMFWWINIDLLYSFEANLKKPRLAPKMEIKQSMIKSNGNFLTWKSSKAWSNPTDTCYQMATFQNIVIK